MSTLAVNAITDAAGGNTATINGMTPTADSLQGFRNRILNGGMGIDQRNAGAAVTINTAAINYTLDRWAAFGQATDGVYTVSRSTTVPSSAGFVNSLAATCTTADTSISATNRYFLNQTIEGTNCADLQFGTAAAQAITLSFWVRSSLTGTYCAAVLNGGGTRSYVAEYTISTADTWEYKTITVPGDTTGTWSTDNSGGMTLRLALAGGSTYQTTANAWAAGNFNTTTNQVNWMSSSSSRTFYITGVQLEAGSVATPFERRDVGRELIMCQRYFQLLQYSYGTSLGTTLIARCTWPLKVTMRANMTIAAVGTPQWFYGGGTATYSSLSTGYSIPEMAQVDMNVTGGASTSGTMCSSSSGGSAYFTASAEL